MSCVKGEEHTILLIDIMIEQKSTATLAPCLEGLPCPPSKLVSACQQLSIFPCNSNTGATAWLTISTIEVWCYYCTTTMIAGTPTITKNNNNNNMKPELGHERCQILNISADTPQTQLALFSVATVYTHHKGKASWHSSSSCRPPVLSVVKHVSQKKID